MSSPPKTAGLVLRCTVSQEMQCAPTISLPSTPPAGTLPYAAYLPPPEIAVVQRLIQHVSQVQAAIHEQSARPDDVQNAVAPRWYQRAPLSACIEPISVERTAYWEIGKASHELTEEDWKVFFLGAKDCDPVDTSKLDAAIVKLKMDTTVQSAESRVSNLVSDFEAELMKLNENRGLKKDAPDFKHWLGDYMRRYDEVDPLMAAAGIAAAKADKLPSSIKTPKARKPPKVVVIVNSTRAIACSVFAVVGQVVSEYHTSTYLTP
ncbi:hypothetical protein DYB34_010217 [Aphanomyces astaci]|uniref:Uncharacterized protein n=1 Tax=Aphanomyces astaci TaxID=112090 RepID=A0A3R6WZG2_APHAT|nr:hypothetical protein DYB34_010217 [Aphanomyces astaci]